jgi:hypothetical protein
MDELEKLILEQEKDAKNYHADTDGGRLVFVDPHFFHGITPSDDD